jgi:SSS family solute:Na+ symporter
MSATIHLSTPDYVVIVGYCVVVIWIGLWFRKRLSTVADYFAGGHQLPWWLAGISHYMSSFSAFAFIAYTQIAYLYGCTAITLFWASVPACVLGGLMFARRWRRARVVTPVEFLQQRYSTQVQQICAWAGIPVKIFDDALKVFATGVFISVTCGVRLAPAVTVCGIVMLSYSFFGGLWALVVTDYVQFLMKSLAIVLLVPLSIHAAGGLRHGLHALPAGNLLLINRPYTTVYIVGFFCLMLLSYNASWSLAQKYYSVEDEHAASKAAYLSAALNFVGAPLMLLPGLLARQFLPDLVASGRSADAYVLLLVKLLPEGMIGIILAAMLSATMAAVSADFNAIASVLTQDVYRRCRRKEVTEQALFQVGRIFTVLLGASTTLLALWIVYSHRESLFGLMVTVFGVFLAPTLLPILAALLTPRVTSTGAITGIVAGFASGLSLLLLRQFSPAVVTAAGGSFTFDGISLLMNIGVTLLGMVAGSMLGKRDADEQERALQFDDRMHTPIAARASSNAAASPMGQVLPLATGAVAVLMGIADALSHSRLAHLTDGAAAVLFAVLSIALARYGSNVEKSQQSKTKEIL